MARTTSGAVLAIIEEDTAVSTAPSIETANNMVTRICDTADSEYDDATLELIERWLSAHFYAIAKKISASEKAGSVGESFQYKLGLNLNVTMWGQQALAIDTEGGLAAASKAAETGGRVRPGVTWLGKPPEEQESVE